MIEYDHLLNFSVQEKEDIQNGFVSIFPSEPFFLLFS